MTSWLHEQRLDAVEQVMQAKKVRTVLDLGCGDGDLVARMAREPRIKRIVGIDKCDDALGRLRKRLRPISGSMPARIELFHASLTDHSLRLAGFECALLIETIEHIDPERLWSVERSVFSQMRPRMVIITTPNAEFNRLLGVPSHCFRHPDHRFEWDRARFRRWAGGVARRHAYAVFCREIAGSHPTLGGASQMAVFTDHAFVSDAFAA
ncbi:MAG: methyltransferase domain-containing protein [Rhizobiaceae bacterium]